MADTNVEETESQEVEGEAEGQAEGQVEGDQTEGEAEGEPETVPYERFQEVVKQVEALSQQVEGAAQQLALAKANPIPDQREATPRFDIYKEVGLDVEDPEDIPNQGQLKQIFSHHAKVFDTRLAEISFLQSHSDYTEIVGTVDEIASGTYAEPLAAAIKKNPALAKDIAKSPNPRLAAYNIAKLQQKKPKGKAVTKEEAEAAISEAAENAKRIKSSSNAKGGGALSEEGRYGSMDDADFLKLAQSHGAFV